MVAGTSFTNGKVSRRWAVAAAGLLLSVAIWQAVQAWWLGALGLPGLAVVSLVSEPSRDDRTAPDWLGGVTTVAKMAATPAPAAPPPEVAPRLEPLAPEDAPSFAPPTAHGGSTLTVGTTVGDEAPSAMPVPRPLAHPNRHDRPATATTPSPGLPWLAAPEGPAPATRMAVLPPQDATPVAPPSRRELSSWIRSRANEFVGGVDDKGMPLYRFDVWLEAPADRLRQIASVAYDYDAPSAKPRAQTSSDRDSRFLVKFGGASCARVVAVAVTLDDGSTQDVEVDGCAILN